jgi:hypothetical protein
VNQIQTRLLFGASLLFAGGGSGDVSVPGAIGVSTGTGLGGDVAGNGGAISLLPTTPGVSVEKLLEQKIVHASVDGAIGIARGFGIAGDPVADANLPGAIGRGDAAGIGGHAGGAGDIPGGLAFGPLKYWVASKWTPEYLAKLRAEDELLVEALS